MNKEYTLLLQAVERALGRSLISSPDFEYLSEQLLAKTGERLSSSTLMRLYGIRSGVHPRKSTLDILARYIGYEDSVAFFASQQECKDNHKPSNNPRKTGKKVRLWWWGAIIALVLLAIVALLIIYRDHSPRRIMHLSEIQNTKQYRISSQRGLRGELGVIDHQLATTYELAKTQRCLEQSNFAILQYEGAYYLYSVADKCFINICAHEVEVPLATDGVKLKLTPRDSCLVFSISWRNTDNTVNINSGNGVIITDYGLQTGDFDEGNMLEVYEAGDFDPTEPLRKLKRMKAEAAKARAHLAGNKAYAIYYTQTDADGSKGTARHWLNADGKLTTVFSDSCRFTLHPIEGDTLYASPSFRVCHHAGNPHDRLGCKYGFTMPQYANDHNTSHRGQLYMPPYNSDNSQGQVFFLGSNGCYAIRCTDVMTERYGAGMFWGTIDADNDGSPDINYSPKPEYIWHVEPL